MATKTKAPDHTEAELDERLVEHGKTVEECKIFLEMVRQSGVTNMFGAASYLTKHMGIPKKLAGDVLVHWMQTYEAPE